MRCCPSRIVYRLLTVNCCMRCTAVHELLYEAYCLWLPTSSGGRPKRPPARAMKRPKPSTLWASLGPSGGISRADFAQRLRRLIINIRVREHTALRMMRRKQTESLAANASAPPSEPKIVLNNLCVLQVPSSAEPLPGMFNLPTSESADLAERRAGEIDEPCLSTCILAYLHTYILGLSTNPLTYLYT